MPSTVTDFGAPTTTWGTLLVAANRLQATREAPPEWKSSHSGWNSLCVSRLLSDVARPDLGERHPLSPHIGAQMLLSTHLGVADICGWEFGLPVAYIVRMLRAAAGVCIG